MPNDTASAQGAVQITVVICTHNRFDDLRTVLDALVIQTLPAETFEVLIVDNSTDHDARNAFRSAYALPGNARWLQSTPPGLSRARNLGLSEARSSIVAFLDDDATPLPGWAEELVLTFRAFPEAAIVAGPIEPRWDTPRPVWIPDKYESCLGILDLGPDDRPLGVSEYGFGANLALRRDPARAVGGFDEALGRKGAASLLSGEEIALQDCLRAAGHGARYAAGARVHHRMQTERLTRNWFRARMAWQSVSVSVQDGGWPWSDWSRAELRRAAAALGMDEALAALLAPRNGQAFADQLDVIQHLIVLFLAAGREPDARLEALFPPLEDAAPAAEPLSDAYRPAAALPGTTQWVFADFSNSHGYLFDLYGDLPGAAFVELPGRGWLDDPHEAIAYLEASLPPQTQAVVLLTLDPFSLDPRGATALAEAVGRWRIPTLAIQHRLPETAGQRQSLAAVARCLHRVVALSDDIALRLRGLVPNVATIPLHPSKFRYVMPGQVERVRGAIGVTPGHTVFGMIGEARKGKGIDLLLAALDHLPTAIRDSVFVLLTGRAGDIEPDAIIDRFAARRVAARIDLRHSADPAGYAVLTSGEYADAIAATDFGLVLYQGAQRDVASGVLSDFVWQRKPVLATHNSFAGAEVTRHRLGLTLDAETPEALAQLMADAVRSRQAGAPPGAEFEAYRHAHSPALVLESLKALLLSIPVPETGG